MRKSNESTDRVALFVERQGLSPECLFGRALRWSRPHDYDPAIPPRDLKRYRRSVDPARHGGRPGEPNIPEYVIEYIAAEEERLAQTAPTRAQKKQKRFGCAQRPSLSYGLPQLIPAR